MIKIKMFFFAGARELVGQGCLELEIPLSSNIAELKKILITKHPKLESLANNAAFAVNEIFVTQDHIILAEDSVAFLPPFSGG